MSSKDLALEQMLASVKPPGTMGTCTVFVIHDRVVVVLDLVTLGDGLMA